MDNAVEGSPLLGISSHGGSINDSNTWKEVNRLIEPYQCMSQINETDRNILKETRAKFGGTILHLAVQHGTEKDLIFFLKDDYFKQCIDTPDNDGRTPFHEAIRSMKKKGKEKYWAQEHNWALKVLLGHGADPNARDKKGRAPLHFVDENQRVNCKRNWETLAGDESSKLSTFVDLDALNGTGHDSTPAGPELPNISPTVDASRDNMQNEHPKKLEKRAKMFNLLMAHDYSEFARELASSERMYEKDIDFYVGNTKLICYVLDDVDGDRNIRTDIVKKLLELGVDPLSCDNRGYECAVVLAVKHQQRDLVKSMIGKLKEKNTKDISFDLLNRTFWMKSDRITDDDKESETLDWLKFLFEIEAITEVNQTNQWTRADGTKETALQTAACFHYERVILFLLKQGAKMSSDNEKCLLEGITPEGFTDLLDHFVRFETSQTHGIDVYCRAVLNYDFLIPISKAQATRNETEPLVTICDEKQHRQAITHALIWTLIMAKWSKLRHLNNAWSSVKIMCSLIVLILFTALAWPISTRQEDPIASTDEQLGLKWTVITLCVINLVVDIVRLVLFWPLQWPVRDKRIVWVRLIYGTVITTLMVMFCAGIRSRSFVAWVLTGAWLDTAITASEKMKWFNVILTMFWKISKHIAKLCVLTLCFVMGSSISFSILIGPRQMNLNSTSLIDFTNPWLAFPRTIAMATGEFGYEELRHGLIEEGQPVASFFDVLFFIVFVFLVYLVIMNVMTGVAIIETKEILDSAEENQLRKKLEYIFLIEHFWDKFKEHFEWLNDPLKTKFDCKLFTSKPSLEVHLKTGKIEYYKDNNTPATKGAIALDAHKTERIRCLFVKIRAERGKQNENVTLQKNVQRLVDSKKQKTETTQL